MWQAIFIDAWTMPRGIPGTHGIGVKAQAAEIAVLLGLNPKLYAAELEQERRLGLRRLLREAGL